MLAPVKVTRSLCLPIEVPACTCAPTPKLRTPATSCDLLRCCDLRGASLGTPGRSRASTCSSGPRPRVEPSHRGPRVLERGRVGLCPLPAGRRARSHRFRCPCAGLKRGLRGLVSPAPPSSIRSRFEGPSGRQMGRQRLRQGLSNGLRSADALRLRRRHGRIKELCLSLSLANLLLEALGRATGGASPTRKRLMSSSAQ